jgi:hypothetical protein
MSDSERVWYMIQYYGMTYEYRHDQQTNPLCIIIAYSSNELESWVRIHSHLDLEFLPIMPSHSGKEFC